MGSYDGFHHVPIRFANDGWFTLGRVSKRSRHGAGSRVECTASWVSRIGVGDDEVTAGVGSDVLVGLGVLLVVDIGIKTAKDCADGWVRDDFGIVT